MLPSIGLPQYYFEAKNLKSKFWLCVTLHVDPIDMLKFLGTSRNVGQSICKLPLNGVPIFEHSRIVRVPTYEIYELV